LLRKTDERPASLVVADGELHRVEHRLSRGPGQPQPRGVLGGNSPHEPLALPARIAGQRPEGIHLVPAEVELGQALRLRVTQVVTLKRHRQPAIR
jgi:hypothetical protein